ncbi:MAG TPA: hypothetical protein VFN35_10410 [Ktedonobacteraceae bacterium]|nr:hypothetical protein [Ktedonobacteraceae bacterium]
MLNEATPLFPGSQWERWEQGNEMTIRTWSDTMKNDTIAEMDAPIVSQSWTELVHSLQERLTNIAHKPFGPQEAWKWWFDVTMDIWRVTIQMGGDPLGMLASGVKAMEQTQEKTPSGECVSFDPFTLFHTWYDATSKQWAGTVEDFISSKQFLMLTGSFLENYSHLTSTFCEASEAYFKMLRLPTLSDIAHVAELLIRLEEKGDDVAETIEDVRAHMTQDATPQAKITALEQRLSQRETRLDKMLAFLEKREAEPTEATGAFSHANDEKQQMNEESEALREGSAEGHLPVEAVPFATQNA